jgi:pimeloyl-ACP methyl ester carboxylesterase
MVGVVKFNNIRMRGRIFIGILLLLWGWSFSVSAQHIQTRTVVSADGVPLNVAEWGNQSGPAIILIHNNALTWESWAPLIGTPLDDEFHLIAFDLRGHGDSGKPWQPESYATISAWANDLAAVMKATNASRPIIVAVGFGGMVAMDYVRHYGIAELAGINLVQTQAGLVKSLPMDEATRAFYAKQAQLHQSPYIADNLAAARVTARNFVADEPEQEWLDRTTTMIMRLPPYVRRLISRHPTQNADLIAQLKLPVLFSVGTRVQMSADAPLDVVRGVAQQLPRGTVSIYPETGRSPYQENTSRFVAELIAFAHKAQGAAKP